MKRKIIGILVLCLTIFTSIYYIGYLCHFWSEITSYWFGLPTVIIIGVILLMLSCVGGGLMED